MKALARTARNAAFQDKLLFALYAYMLLRALFAPSHDGGHALLLAAGLFAAVVVHLLLTRGELLSPARLRAGVYRAGITLFVLTGYLQMRALMSALQPALLDAQLLALDEQLFGRTAVHWLAPLTTPGSIEWFAFFYYSYYWLLPLHGVPAMVFHEGKRLAELAAGIIVIACVAYGLYTLVPAVGPYAAYPIEAPLDQGFWWQQVLKVVDNLGAQIDIFPSLHTAFPCFLALHAFRHRRMDKIYRYVWLPTAFFALNITCATLFLRWHYGVDTLAGLLLAIIAQRTAITIAAKEQQQTRAQPIFEPLWLRAK